MELFCVYYVTKMINTLKVLQLYCTMQFIFKVWTYQLVRFLADEDMEQK